MKQTQIINSSTVVSCRTALTMAAFLAAAAAVSLASSGLGALGRRHPQTVRAETLLIPGRECQSQLSFSSLMTQSQGSLCSLHESHGSV